MAKKAKRGLHSGNVIQIEFEKYLGDDRYMNGYLTLNVIALNFQSANDDEWRGVWNGQEIWVKFTRPGYDIIFSDNFPGEHTSAAIEEVNRIERQFN